MSGHQDWSPVKACSEILLRHSLPLSLFMERDGGRKAGRERERERERESGAQPDLPSLASQSDMAISGWELP